MGIDGLLPIFKPVIYSGHISSFSNQKAAIDAMGWLYRGAYSCALDLAINKPTDHYLLFTYNMITLLKRWTITPIFCLDGRDLDSKERTLRHRTIIKDREKEKAFGILQNGNETEAQKAFSRCLNVTKDMIHRLADMLRILGVEFIIAPYEADAQVAYLCRTGYANFAISEDSNLLCYNVPVTVFKLGTFGECDFVDLNELRLRRKNKERLKTGNLDILMDLTEQDFIHACVLAGCDYLPSVKGMGLKKALNYFDRFKTLDTIVKRMRVDPQFMGKVPEEYEEVVRRVSYILAENKYFIGECFLNVESFVKGLMDIETLTRRMPTAINVKESSVC